ncbi:hypothetical protein GYMLUDRAFT_982793 [Collybiopsis luxurians FD-317 M1]|uniref:Uncharacterized protein n=1 Tax=Collybiopsis luxurians FD-317 M1 TaxID=944289 RepID=A0A0D0C0G1_9AGAR|nr:hypothetical protein GYMLUDRAFT_982793 [Collybiopsis luxurians FD-317 M1]
MSTTCVATSSSLAQSRGSGTYNSEQERQEYWEVRKEKRPENRVSSQHLQQNFDKEGLKSIEPDNNTTPLVCTNASSSDPPPPFYGGARANQGNPGSNEIDKAESDPSAGERVFANYEKYDHLNGEVAPRETDIQSREQLERVLAQMVQIGATFHLFKEQAQKLIKKEQDDLELLCRALDNANNLDALDTEAKLFPEQQISGIQAGPEKIQQDRIMQLQAREARVAVREEDVAVREEDVAAREEHLALEEKRLKEKNASVTAREDDVVSREKEVAEREEDIATREACIKDDTQVPYSSFARRRAELEDMAAKQREQADARQAELERQDKELDIRREGVRRMEKEIRLKIDRLDEERNDVSESRLKAADKLFEDLKLISAMKEERLAEQIKIDEKDLELKEKERRIGVKEKQLEQLQNIIADYLRQLRSRGVGARESEADESSASHPTHPQFFPGAGQFSFNAQAIYMVGQNLYDHLREFNRLR